MIGWRTISSAPKDGTRVLLWYPKAKRTLRIGYWFHSKHFVNGVCDYDKAEWSVDGSDYGKPQQPTHWQPMPKGPGEK